MLIARQASASMQGLYNTGSSTRVNWLGVMNYSGTVTSFISNESVRSGDYIYNVGYKTVSGINIGIIVKTSNSGDVVWQKTITQSGSNVTLRCATVDTDGNLYVGGTSGTTVATWAKFNSSGSMLYARTVTSTSTITKIHYLADRDCIISLNNSNASTMIFYIIDKTLGTVLDGRSYGPGLAGAVTIVNQLFSIPGTNQVHMVGSWNSTSASYPRPFYQKIDIGTGAFGSRSLFYLNSTVATALNGVSLSNITSNTFYATGYTREGGSTQNKPFFIKLNTTGTISWQKRMNVGTLGASVMYNITNDANDNLITIGTENTNTRLMINGISGLGNLNFSNLFDTPYNDITTGIHSLPNKFIFTGNQFSNNSLLYGSLPYNGTVPGTGSYSVAGQAMTYQSTFATLADTALTKVDLTVVSGTIISATVATPAYTVANGTDVLTTVNI